MMKNYGKRIAEYMPWLLLTGCVEGICILFLALADVQVLQVLAGVLTLMTVLMYAGVCIYIVKKYFTVTFIKYVYEIAVCGKL